MLDRYTNTPQAGEPGLEPGSTDLESVVLAAELLSRRRNAVAGNKKAACSAARSMADGTEDRKLPSTSCIGGAARGRICDREFPPRVKHRYPLQTLCRHDDTRSSETLLVLGCERILPKFTMTCQIVFTGQRETVLPHSSKLSSPLVKPVAYPLGIQLCQIAKPTQQPRAASTKTNTTISSICRHHPCPRPAFTPYPTHSPTPPASSASIPLAQLLAPRRRHAPTPRGQYCCPPGLCSCFSLNPLGGIIVMSTTIHLPDGCQRNSAPSRAV